MNKLEMGDNLEKVRILALKAAEWFKLNKVPVPIKVVDWQKSSVRLGEIPPGMGYSTLVRREKIKIKTLIALINDPESYIKETEYFPITPSNIENIVGLIWVSDFLVSQHKKVTIKCKKCSREETLDYGTLQRMRKSSDKYCRYCRNAGGKGKELSEYNVKGFTPLTLQDSKVTFECNTCGNQIRRGLNHSKKSDYLVCEFCHPNINVGTKIYTELGDFDSNMEYESYKILLKYFSKESIERQVSYNTLFKTGTNHTADFYIKPLDLVIEVTTVTNNLGYKHADTLKWKQSLSSSVYVAKTLTQVEDIVRPLAKVRG